MSNLKACQCYLKCFATLAASFLFKFNRVFSIKIDNDLALNEAFLMKGQLIEV